jgi:hypothetical protein
MDGSLWGFPWIWTFFWARLLLALLFARIGASCCAILYDFHIPFSAKNQNMAKKLLSIKYAFIHELLYESDTRVMEGLKILGGGE